MTPRWRWDGRARWVAIFGFTLSLLGCERAGERLSEGSLERYTLRLIERAGGGMKVSGCHMFGPTRAGYCLATASPKAWAALERSLGLREVKLEPAFQRSCLDLDGYGKSSASQPSPREPLARTKGLQAGSAALPTNTNNVHFVALYLNPAESEVCFEYEFPYG